MKELIHYSVKGMKWGVRKEYEPHPRKKNGNTVTTASGRIVKKITDPNKQLLKYAAIGVGIGAAVLATYGLNKSGYLDGLSNKGKVLVVDTIERTKNLNFAKTYDADEVYFKKKSEPTLNTVSSLMFDVSKTNPSNGSTNCVACSIGLEMRRRGFDASALKDYDNVLKHTEIYSKIFKNINVEYISNVLNRKQNLQKTIDAISKFPNGARGMINVDLSRAGAVSAHAFSWEKIDGVVHFIDGQNGNDYTANGKLEKVFNMVVLESVRYARLDNLDIDYTSDILKQMVK